MAEKTELREEKQRLKTEKDSLDVKIKSENAQQGLLQPTVIPAPFSGPGKVVGSKLMPFMGYPGVSMWQFMPPTAVDTSPDHVMCPPAQLHKYAGLDFWPALCASKKSFPFPLFWCSKGGSNRIMRKDSA